MEDMIRKLEDYNSKKEKYMTRKTSTLINAKEFYKEEK